MYRSRISLRLHAKCALRRVLPPPRPSRELSRSTCRFSKVHGPIKSSLSRSVVSNRPRSASGPSPISSGTLDLRASTATQLHIDGGAGKGHRLANLRSNRPFGDDAEALTPGRQPHRMAPRSLHGSSKRSRLYNTRGYAHASTCPNTPANSPKRATSLLCRLR